MILWRYIENYSFYHFDSDSRFPPFYHMLGGNLGSPLYGDVSVMLFMIYLFTVMIYDYLGIHHADRTTN